MLKNISNLGKALDKAEQKEINGGLKVACCNPTYACCDPCWVNNTGSGCQYRYGNPSTGYCM